MTDSQYRPPEPPTLPDAHWQRRRQQVMAGFEQARPARRGRRRALIAVVVPALLVVAALSAGAYARAVDRDRSPSLRPASDALRASP
jgi:hypothetical protein